MNLQYEDYTREEYLNGFKLSLGEVVKKIDADLADPQFKAFAAGAKCVRGLADIALDLVDDVLRNAAHARRLASEGEPKAEEAQDKREDTTAAFMQLMGVCELINEQYQAYEMQSGKMPMIVQIDPADLSPDRVLN